MAIAPPIKILFFDPEAGKECVFVLIGYKLGLLEYESVLTGRTILLTLEEALLHRI
ncbi:MAG: hypothetical protein NDF57_05195 [archaeon GBS-70-058]|nr:hypothetical protein [Candidatus Culexarchaeum nevadense]